VTGRDVYLSGFAFTGFRSVYTEDMAMIGPLSKITLLAGRNNAGKSNILRFASRYLKNHKRSGTPDHLDIPQKDDGSSPPPFEFAIAIHEDSDRIQSLYELMEKSRHGFGKFLREAFNLPACRLTDDELIWIRMIMPTDGSPETIVSGKQCIQLAEEAQPGVLQELSTALTSTSGGSQGDDARRILQQTKIFESLPKIELIETIRQINNNPSESGSYNGTGLIAALQKLQNPTAANRRDREKFQAINRFVQTVFEDREARLEIPHNLETINISRLDSVLPLDNYGTGIHQVIILAAAATVLQNQLLCIEEPEANLHPILQRQLLHYLRENTNNQYLIATHSPQMLDYEKSAVFALVNGPSGTEIVAARTAAHVSNICVDLGYRPSDLLQTNAVIWVEGPSDRIYIRYFIDVISKRNLVEGVHYSIMFYGGRLLNSLTAEDAAYVDDFISLRNLNRFMAVVIDSDKTSEDAPLNSTKLRIVEELESAEEPGISWVTSGYTIENYVPDPLLRSVCREIYPNDDVVGSADSWSNPLRFPEKPDKKADKVRVARTVCSRWQENDWPSDLTDSVTTLVEMLNLANDAVQVKGIPLED
jgi:predicted ATPase